MSIRGTKIRITILAVLGQLLLVWLNPLAAQPQSLFEKKMYFEQLPVDLGLSQRSINCIIQDSDGFLWIGTWSGLHKYDGYSITSYVIDNSVPNRLKSNKITALLETNDSTIWVGTMVGGLFRFNKKDESFIQYVNDPDDTQTISDNNIWNIVEDNDKNLWIATQNGLNKLIINENRFESWYNDKNDPHSLVYDFITNLHLDDDNILWVSTENGVCWTDLDNRREVKFNRIVYLDEENPYLHNYVYAVNTCLSRNKKEVFWITKKGLKQLKPDGSVINHEVPLPDPKYSFFRAMAHVELYDPFLLLGSEDGLYVFDVDRGEFLKYAGSYDFALNLSQNTIAGLLLDQSGVLWAGTKKGINKFDTYSNNFRLYKTSDFDPTNSIITGMANGNSSGQWLSTLGGGLFRLQDLQSNSEKIEHYSLVLEEKVNFSRYVQKLVSDKHGNIWLGTAGDGVYVFNENDIDTTQHIISKYRHYSTQTLPAISDDYIMSIHSTLGGITWIGTWSQGLNMITPNNEVLQIDIPAISNMPIVTLYQDKDEYLWVGTRGKGLYRLTVVGQTVVETKPFRYRNAQGSISTDYINTIYEDSEGKLWVGTEDGLNLYNKDSETFRVFRTNNNLIGNEVVALLEDQNELLWVAQFNGIVVIDPTDTTGNIVVSEFDSRNRIQGGFHYNEVAFKNEKGELFFGGSNGFNIINPDEIISNPNTPNVSLSQFRIFNEPLELNTSFNGRIVLSEPLDKIDTIRLRYNENSISVDFAALHYAVPEKNRFAYKLEGFSENWQYTSAGRRFANYTNLNDGTYALKVKAANDDGKWSEETKTLTIILAPPWWKTPWAYGLYVVIAALLLLLFRRLILARAAYEHEIKYERLKRQNTEELNQVKLQFFTNISHEFRTPLTLILGPIESLLKHKNIDGFVSNQLKVLNHNALRLHRLADQLLDFRKVEAGNLELRVAEGNFYKFVKEIKLSFNGLAEQKKVNFKLESFSDQINLWYDRDQFEKVLYNLLSNAFKHVNEDGKIVIEIKEIANGIALDVFDNGVGIEEKHVKRIFDRFYSAETNSSTGTGIGLSLAKSLVEMHGGTIAVKSKKNKFSRFRILMKKGSDHFNSDQIIEDFRNSEHSEHYELLEAELHAQVYVNEVPLEVDESLPNILLVEDNDRVRAFVKSVLKNRNNILEAEDGKQGMEMAVEQNPDLIISDVMMPVMDGFTMCKELKENINTSHIPIILLTARTSLIYTVQGLENGANDYITKPFNTEILLLKINNLLKAKEQLKSKLIAKKAGKIEPKHFTDSTADEEFMIKALEILEQNMTDAKYTVSQLGRDIGMSRMQLYRKIKALTNLSPNQFMRMLRIKLAAELLDSGKYNVSEVTYMIGFTDPAYFRTCFRKQFDMNPSDYLQSKNKQHILTQ